ncbi:MAG: DUF4091 domain-containing protein [Eubacteriales bacterium]|nr:DUF4091 domain-containing protein [Eubacteriales bacterium]MDD4134207.1 DUF4091 domain-containing protein [Eubacteriales bacterium]
MRVKLKLVSGLGKVFHDQEPTSYPGDCPASMLGGEVFSLQAAYMLHDAWEGDLPRVRIDFDCALPLRVRQVTGVPVRFPKYSDGAGAYLRDTPGVYPDILRNLGDTQRICLYPGFWSALWIDVEPAKKTPAGEYPLKVTMMSLDGEVLAEAGITLLLLDARLPEQKLICSRWLHADSLAQVYHLPMFSVEHIRVLRGFLHLASKRGINMAFTPIHTPPILIQDGRERPEAQLVDVFVTPLGYTFRFAKLRDFISLCRHEGIKYFEMAPFFSPRGGYHAATIMGVKDGTYSMLFGPQTQADDRDYQFFLSAYIPALLKELCYIDALDQSFFHLSDMPGKQDRAQYGKLLSFTCPLLSGRPIIDTPPDPDFLDGTEPGLAPVPELDQLMGFAGSDRWASLGYRHHGAYPDTLIAMPGCRTRVLGCQLYIEQIRGISHWALNYYAAQSAGFPIDPYINTDCDGLAPAGDAHLLYPGQGGTPEESIRMMHFLQALQDLRALEALEKKAGRDRVLEIIHYGLAYPLSLTEYPSDEAWLLGLRHRVNLALTAN